MLSLARGQMNKKGHDDSLSFDHAIRKAMRTHATEKGFFFPGQDDAEEEEEEEEKE